jgi:hypothetical protein
MDEYDELLIDAFDGEFINYDSSSTSKPSSSTSAGTEQKKKPTDSTAKQPVAAYPSLPSKLQSAPSSQLVLEKQNASYPTVQKAGKKSTEQLNAEKVSCVICGFGISLTNVSLKSNKQGANEPSKAAPPRPPRSKPVTSSSTEGTSKEDRSGIARKWKDVLVRAGIRIEFAWKFAIALSEAHFDETNALTLTNTDLMRLGIYDEGEQDAIINTIQLIAKEMEEADRQHAIEKAENIEDDTKGEEEAAHARKTWRNLLIRANLGKEWGPMVTAKYAGLLARAGWDDWNVDNLTDGDLQTAGISDPLHREVILQLVERELQEAQLNPNALLDKKHAVTKEEIEYVKMTREEISKQLEDFEVFQQRLSEILRGDTDKQREARAKREALRAMQKREREKKRLEKNLNM